MTDTTSRRSILTGTAAALAGGVSLNLTAPPAARATAPDPIFSAIEKHKAAYVQHMAAVRVRATTVDVKWSKDYAGPEAIAAADRDQDETRFEFEDANEKLFGIRPTNLATVFALLKYIEAFNSGVFGLKGGYLSARDQWPLSLVDFDSDLDVAEEEVPWTILSHLAVMLDDLVSTGAAS